MQIFLRTLCTFQTNLYTFLNSAEKLSKVHAESLKSVLQFSPAIIDFPHPHMPDPSNNNLLVAKTYCPYIPSIVFSG